MLHFSNNTSESERNFTFNLLNFEQEKTDIYLLDTPPASRARLTRRNWLLPLAL